MSKAKKVNRSAESGEFVSADAAKANPKEIYADTVPVNDRPTWRDISNKLAIELSGLQHNNLINYHVVVDIGELAMPCITGAYLDKENKRIVWLTDLSVPQESVPGTEAHADDFPDLQPVWTSDDINLNDV